MTELFSVLGKTVWIEDMAVDVEGDTVGMDDMGAGVDVIDRDRFKVVERESLSILSP